MEWKRIQGTTNLYLEALAYLDVYKLEAKSMRIQLHKYLTHVLLDLPALTTGRKCGHTT